MLNFNDLPQVKYVNNYIHDINYIEPCIIYLNRLNFQNYIYLPEI